MTVQQERERGDFHADRKALGILRADQKCDAIDRYIQCIEGGEAEGRATPIFEPGSKSTRMKPRRDSLGLRFFLREEDLRAFIRWLRV